MKKLLHKHPFTFSLLVFVLAGVGVDVINNVPIDAIRVAIVGAAAVLACYFFWEQ